MVTNRSRVVTCASAPISTHGSGQSVNGCQRRCPSLVYGYGVSSVSRLTTWSGMPDAVVAQIVGGLGDLDDLAGVQEGAADVELHSASRAHAGSMKTPSASTVTPSASEIVPRAKTLTPSARSIHASATKRAQRRAAQVLHGDGSGEARLGQSLAGRLAEHVVEHQRADAAVHQAGRALVGRPEDELAPAAPVAVVAGRRPAARSGCTRRPRRCPAAAGARRRGSSLRPAWSVAAAAR